jgi:PAS domain S-box-containing protein
MVHLPASQACSLTLAPDMSYLPQGRAFAAAAARKAGFSEERVFDITLASSEAIANAMEHAPTKGQIELTVTVNPDRFEVLVEGPGEFQAPKLLQERGHRGMGLPLMARLADHLALYSGPRGGTLVSLTFYRPGAEREAEALPPSIRGLIEQNELTAAITENAPVGLCVLGSDLQYRWANQTYQSYLDEAFRTADLAGVALAETIPRACGSTLLVEIEAVSRTGESVMCRDQLVEGFERGPAWWRYSVVPLRGEEGDPPYDLLLVVGEETDRKRLEEELKRREQQALHLIQHAPAPVFEVDLREPKFVWVNDVLCEELGYSREELLKISPFALLEEESADKLRERMRALQAGSRPNPFVDYTCLTKDGRRLAVVLDVSFEYEGGLPARALVVGHDVTARNRTEEERRRTEERQALLLQLSDMLRMVGDPDEMRYHAARMLGECMGTERAYFAEVSNENDEIIVSRDYCKDGLPSRAGSYRASDFPSIVRVLSRGRPFTVADARTSGRLSARLRDEFRRSGCGSLAAVPLVKDEATLWSINLVFLSEHRWSKDEIGLMREVADRTWTAVERTRAEAALRASEERYRLLAAENERLYRQQLDIAENLQLALLNIPSEIGPIKLGHLYRSATEAARVGGDFYDVFEVKEGNVAILIGDVAGHGIQAARTATLVKDVVNAFTHQSLRTHEVLRRTNLLLIEKELPGFVTVFLGILDRNTGHLRYSSAGHPETLIRRASGQIEPLGCGYSPLGVYSEASWKANSTYLDVDDLLVLYTDGVIEARRNGELFGEKRLERLLKRRRLSPRRLPHLVLDQVLAFAGGNLDDDVAVLALSLSEIAGERGTQVFKQESLLH